jgi:glycyl-tRNA synthetase
VFSYALQEEILEDGNSRTVLRLPAVLAPVKAAILPLIKRDGLPELAKEIEKELRQDYIVQYDDKDAVGRRYRRQDAIGTPFCITVDHQSLEDRTVTLRYRDSMLQERISISELTARIGGVVAMKSWLLRMDSL